VPGSVQAPDEPASARDVPQLIASPSTATPAVAAAIATGAGARRPIGARAVTPTGGGSLRRNVAPVDVEETQTHGSWYVAVA
jgi:hypothetical protein